MGNFGLFTPAYPCRVPVSVGDARVRADGRAGLIGRRPRGGAGRRRAPRGGIEPPSLVLIQSQAGPASRPTGEGSPEARPAAYRIRVVDHQAGRTRPDLDGLRNRRLRWRKYPCEETLIVTTLAPAPAAAPPTERQHRWEQIALAVFIAVPFLALLVAVPVAWGWGLSWRDVVIGLVFYTVSGLGITVGFHRYFTHGAFKANAPAQGRPRRHGLHGDRGARSSAGSPTTAATTRSATATATRTRRGATARRSPRCSRACGGRTSAGCSTSSRPRAASTPPTSSPTATSSASTACSCRLVAVSLLATRRSSAVSGRGAGRARSPRSSGPRSCGSACCTTSPGRSTRSATRSASARSTSRDRSGNVWWLAVLSFGESWHNLHHADPTCARHGVEKGQVDISRPGHPDLRAGSAGPRDVRWPTAKRLDARRVGS